MPLTYWLCLDIVWYCMGLLITKADNIMITSQFLDMHSFISDILFRQCVQQHLVDSIAGTFCGGPSSESRGILTTVVDLTPEDPNSPQPDCPRDSGQNLISPVDLPVDTVNCSNQFPRMWVYILLWNKHFNQSAIWIRLDVCILHTHMYMCILQGSTGTMLGPT